MITFGLFFLNALHKSLIPLFMIQKKIKNKHKHKYFPVADAYLYFIFIAITPSRGWNSFFFFFYFPFFSSYIVFCISSLFFRAMHYCLCTSRDQNEWKKWKGGMHRWICWLPVEPSWGIRMMVKGFVRWCVASGKKGFPTTPYVIGIYIYLNILENLSSLIFSTVIQKIFHNTIRPLYLYIHILLLKFKEGSSGNHEYTLQ